MFHQCGDLIGGDAIHKRPEGRGLWRLSTDGSETIVRYDWSVETTKRWMNLLAPIARPLFEWNHNVVMSWGAKGLAERLGARVVEEKT